MSEEGKDDSRGHADAEKGGVRFDKATGETVNITSTDVASYGLTKSELKTYADDPTWIKIRWSFFSLFWIVWLGMLGASLAIIMQTSCTPSDATGAGNSTIATTVASVVVPSPSS